MSRPAGARLVALVGPTAAGKSELALGLAERFDMEIVNADAFCVYRGMDIGTAKPSAQDRNRVRHHLIDILDVEQAMDVASYQRLARAAITSIHERGGRALLTGGSGLYVQSVLDDLRFPGTDPRVRALLEQELAEVGALALHRRLAQVDPAAAAQILATNGRRIVRALEVNEITGAPYQASLGQADPWQPSLRLGWDPGVDVVDSRIAARVDQMWAAGLVAEVASLHPALAASRTASRAVGYAQILAAFAADQDPETAKEPTNVATRRLARRQRSWFRRDPEVIWLECPSHAEQIIGTLEA
ncbi:MAG: tRNA (adenosine(37)-N6)-dimethylallyltransferase MiaA [Candidatus Nanopelagicales bacterium]|nr:tRNA (adenosine(37)-N6)-dimethylallyltransferase MiaA [Candidatus Nanopelagicales bacterium]